MYASSHFKVFLKESPETNSLPGEIIGAPSSRSEEQMVLSQTENALEEFF